MATYETALKKLTNIYKKLQEHNNDIFEVNRRDYDTMDIGKRDKMERYFKFMEQEGWIEEYYSNSSQPIRYRITSRGIKAAEGHIEKPTIVSNTFNIGENYGVAATNANDFVINQGISFADIEKLVNEKIVSADERKVIIETLQGLEELMKSGRPIEKGFFVKIKALLQENSWLSSPVMGKLLEYFT